MLAANGLVAASADGSGRPGHVLRSWSPIKRVVAQAVEQQVEQSARLVALFGRPGREGHAAEAGQDVGRGDVAPQAAVGGACRQQGGDGGGQALPALRERVAARGDHGAQRLGHRITTPFGAQSTAEEVIAGIDLSGQRAIVTGGSSGIGAETARVLAGAGAEVTLAVRNLEAGVRTARDIGASTGRGEVLVSPLDLADPASVAAFIANWDGPLHILVNNAGVMAPPETRTPQGRELQFATNHLGHFALDRTALRPRRGRRRPHRVVSSVGHVNAESTSTTSTSPTAPTTLARLRPVEDGQHPVRRGGRAPLGRRPDRSQRAEPRPDHGHEPLPAHGPRALVGLRASGMFTYKTIEQGAATSVLVATSPLLVSVGGRYFEDGQEAVVLAPGAAETGGSGVAPYALDPEAAARLWRVSAAALDR